MQAPQDSYSTHPIFNPSIIIEICGDSPEVIQGFVDLFLEQAPKQLGDLVNACNEGNLDAIKNMSHKLKGSTAYVGAERMSFIANQMELDASESNLKSCQKLIQDIQISFKELTHEIKKMYPNV